MLFKPMRSSEGLAIPAVRYFRHLENLGKLGGEGNQREGDNAFK